MSGGSVSAGEPLAWLKAALWQQYGLAAGDLTAVPGGLVNRAHRAGDWFVKVYDTAAVPAAAAERSIRLHAFLAERGAAVPKVARSVSGEPLARAGGHVVAVMEWVSGQSLDPARVTPADPAQAGRLLAAVHDLGSAFGECPGRSRARSRWERSGTTGPPFRSRLAASPATAFDRGIAKTAQSVRTLPEAALERLAAATGTWGLCHRAFHGGNVLASGDRRWVVDFDNAGYSHREVEVLTAWNLLAAGDAAEPAWRAAGAAFVAAYQQERRGSLAPARH